jgi:hypothetical protein
MDRKAQRWLDSYLEGEDARFPEETERPIHSSESRRDGTP